MRLNVEEEQSIAFAIRDAEKAAWDAVAAVGSRPPSKGRTRAAQVRALEIAVEQLMLRSFKEPALKPAANAARRAWNEAETQHWNLAMSAERIARGEAKKLGGMLLSQEDLEQEGHIGLLRAARRFDPDLGIRFSTYARWWVRAQMTRVDQRCHPFTERHGSGIGKHFLVPPHRIRSMLKRLERQRRTSHCEIVAGQKRRLADRTQVVSDAVVDDMSACRP